MMPADLNVILLRFTKEFPIEIINKGFIGLEVSFLPACISKDFNEYVIIGSGC